MAPIRREVLAVGPLGLPGEWGSPQEPLAFVLFAHGSGSSRLSPRNRRVAQALNERGLATLLFDLLDEREAAAEANRFDIELLTGRLLQVMQWLADPTLALPGPRPKDWPVLALFGASTGAAVALRAAAARPGQVFAVVSRGGRGDLAGGEALAQVRAPTLLVVGGDDLPVAALNRKVLLALPGERRLEVVPHADHLFERPPAALDTVAELAADWFLRHRPQH